MLLAVWDDADNLFLCLSGDFMDDLFKLLALVVLLAFQGAEAVSFDVSNDMKQGLLITVAVGKILATLCSVIVLLTRLDSFPMLLNGLHAMELPVDIYMIICLLARDPKVVLYSAIPFGVIFLIASVPCLKVSQRKISAVRLQVIKRGAANAGLIFCSVFINGIVNSDGMWDKLSLEQKLPWYRAIFGLGFAYMVYISIVRTCKNYELSKGCKGKKSSRHIAHQVYFMLEALFHLFAFMYVCSGLGRACLAALMLLIALFVFRYLLFHLGFNGDYKFLTPTKKLKFLLDGKRSGDLEWWEAYPDIFGDENDELKFVPKEKAPDTNLQTEGQELSPNKQITGGRNKYSDK